MGVFPMSVVKVDRRRIYIPKEIPFSAKKVLIIPLGSKLMIIPVPDKPIEIDTQLEAKKSGKLADEKARKDALSRRKDRR